MSRKWFIFQQDNDTDLVIRISLSPNGWTDDFLCLEWFQKVFIPMARARANGEPVLLIFDGHGSHVTDEMLRIAFGTPGVHLYCIPAHTSHKLQPLDVGVFGPLQRAWTERCDEVVFRTGKGITRGDVVKEYMAIRKKTFSAELIRKAFQRAGLNPINENVFTADDFAPSIATSTVAHMPASYPSCPEAPSLPAGPSISAADSESAPASSTATGGPVANAAPVPDSQPIPSRLPGPSSTDSRCHAEAASSDSEPESDFDSESDADSEDDEESATEESSELPVVVLHRMPHTLAPHTNLAAGHPTPNTSLSVPVLHSVAESSQAADASSSAPPISLDALSTTVREPEFQLSGIRPRWSLKRKLQAAIADNNRLVEELKRVRYERDSATTHANLAQEEIERLRERLNGKDNKRKKRTITLPRARFLTGEEGRAEWEKERAERERKAQLKAEREAAKARKAQAAEARREQVAREGDNTVFSGALTRKNKGELQDIASALHLTFDLKHQKKELIELIMSHLQANETTLRTSRRFSGLYAASAGRSSHMQQAASSSRSRVPAVDAGHPIASSTAPLPPQLPDSCATSESRPSLSTPNTPSRRLPLSNPASPSRATRWNARPLPALLAGASMSLQAPPTPSHYSFRDGDDDSPFS